MLRNYKLRHTNLPICENRAKVGLVSEENEKRASTYSPAKRKNRKRGEKENRSEERRERGGGQSWGNYFLSLLFLFD